MSRHQGPRKGQFKCTAAWCRSAFNSYDKLQAHLRSAHTPRDSFLKSRMCPFRGCRWPSKYADLQSLKEHLRLYHLPIDPTYTAKYIKEIDVTVRQASVPAAHRDGGEEQGVAGSPGGSTGAVRVSPPVETSPRGSLIAAPHPLKPRDALALSLERDGAMEATTAFELLRRAIVAANAVTADGDLVARVLQHVGDSLSSDDVACIVAMCVVFHLRLPEPFALRTSVGGTVRLVPWHEATLQERSLCRVFDDGDAEWIDTVRSGRLPPHNGAGGNRALYPRALELALRLRDGRREYDHVIDRLLQLPDGDPGVALETVLRNARDRALPERIRRHVPSLSRAIQWVAARPMSSIKKNDPRFREDHCWCDACGKEPISATYANGQSTNICTSCGWIICSRGSCQKRGSSSRFHYQTGARLPAGECLRRTLSMWAI